MVPPPSPPPVVGELPVGDLSITGTIQSNAPDSGLFPSTFGAVLLHGDTELSALDEFCFPANAPSFLAVGRSFTIPQVAPGSYVVLAYRMSYDRENFERTATKVTVGAQDVAMGNIPLLSALTATVEQPDEDPLVKWKAPGPGFKGFAFRLNEDFEEACHAGSQITVAKKYETRPRETEKVKVAIESVDTLQLAIRVEEVDED